MKTRETIFLFRDADQGRRLGVLGQQAVASALMLCMVPLSLGDVFAQNAPPPPPPDQVEQGAPPPPQGSAYQPLPPEELDRLVAPIALYPDSLVAQVLAASTYPAQVSSAEQFVQQNQGAPPEQVAQMADQQPWDPSVKALTAFPQVLSTLTGSMGWTTQLGNAYYNQPQDVMNAVQEMRGRAYQSGNLRTSQQLNVQYAPGNIVIVPASPQVVYVPYYNPWAVYGPPIAPWGGYYYHPNPGFGVGLGVGLAVGFGVGVALGAFLHFGWGFHNWAPNWGAHTIVYQHNTYISNSVTVVNHGNYGGFDRNPQARAFNRTQAVQFANVNHTTINNVTVNRTNVNNTNINRTNVNSVNNNRTNVNNNNRNVVNSNNNRGVAPNSGAAYNPRTQQNYNRSAQPGQAGQYNNSARPAAQTGQFNNNSARPAQTNGQVSTGARPANTEGAKNYNGAGGQQGRPAAEEKQQRAPKENRGGHEEKAPKSESHEHR
jgi:hypothetical protein